MERGRCERGVEHLIHGLDAKNRPPRRDLAGQLPNSVHGLVRVARGAHGVLRIGPIAAAGAGIDIRIIGSAQRILFNIADHPRRSPTPAPAP